MKIKEWNKLLERDNKTCHTIDELVDRQYKYSDDDFVKLLEEAEDIICDYRALCCKLVDSIDIENCIS